MLVFAFILSTIALILQCILLPRAVILAFSPFLALAILRCTLVKSLYLSLIAGIIMDLVSNDPIGVHAINYTLTTFLLFSLKKHFLHEEPFHLSILTAILSFFLTFFGAILLFLFDRRVPLEGRWVLADLFGMQVVDGLFAFVWFAAPLTLFTKCKKMWALFWLKRKRLSHTSL